MASSNIDISGLDYLNNTDYAMSSGLEDWNDEEKMNKLLAAVVADEVPEIRDTPSETIFNRVINRVSPPDPDGPDPRRGMFRVTPGREGESVYGEENFTFEDLMKSAANLPYLDSGLDYLNAKEESSQAHMDKLGAGFYAPTKQTEEEPELFGTLWNLIQKSLQKDLTGMFGEGKDDTPFFKPLSASQLVEHEKFVNQAPLVERWAAQMKEEIGWQYMTPDERKDYIKKNKNNKNNHIIMDYNMYRRG